MLARHDIDQMIGEHHALMRQYGQAQVRCSELIREQAIEIARLQGRAIRQQAALIVRDTASAWGCDQRAAPGKASVERPRGIPWLDRLPALLAHLMDVVRTRSPALRFQAPGQPSDEGPAGERAGVISSAEGRDVVEDLASLEASLLAADLVICQTGCLSHGAYWRVQDHCKRTGKTCVLVTQPDAVRIVRIQEVAQTH